MVDAYDNVTDLWARVAMENVRKIEEACEKSVNDPQKRGVFVIENQFGTVLSADLNEKVPTGHVYITTRHEEI